MRTVLAGCCLLVAAAAPSAAVADTLPSVSTVECPSNEEDEAEKLQGGQALPLSLDAHQAEQLSYYRSGRSLGVFAPKGWSCRAQASANGRFLVVTPNRLMPPFYPLPNITGPAVTLNVWDGESTGRFHVAIMIAKLFSAVGGEFAARVKQEHFIQDSSFNPTHSLDDDVTYLSDRLLQYTTPANRAGLGTEDMLEVSNLPIRGLMTLSSQAEAFELTEVRIRVPLAPQAQTLLQLELACVQLQRGCRRAE